jgi:hypothetical protein
MNNLSLNKWRWRLKKIEIKIPIVTEQHFFTEVELMGH